MDTVANMLITIVNAQRVGKERVVLANTNYREKLAGLLQKKGAVAKIKVKDGAKPELVVTLTYDEGEPKVKTIKRISSPGQRVYVTKDQLPHTGGRLGFYVISTSAGLMDEREAKAKGMGGELVCEVWF